MTSTPSHSASLYLLTYLLQFASCILTNINRHIPSDSQLKSLTVKPDPPRPGETLEITAKADVLETIKVGSPSPAIC
jgi:hypothetical protein